MIQDGRHTLAMTIGEKTTVTIDGQEIGGRLAGVDISATPHRTIVNMRVMAARRDGGGNVDLDVPVSSLTFTADIPEPLYRVLLALVPVPGE